MNIPRQRNKILNLHAEYESMVKFFKFAIEKAQSDEDKHKFQSQLKISQSMTNLLEVLLNVIELLGDEKNEYR